MATYTSFLNLEKPTTSETFNLLKMNQNWDKIDQGVSSLNSNFSWNALSPVTGTTQMTLPDQTRAKEFIFIARYGTSQGLQYLVFSFPIPNLTDIRDFTFTQGYALANGNGFAQVMFNGSSHKANLVTMTISGTDYVSTSQLMCFYR